jgi:integrase
VHKASFHRKRGKDVYVFVFGAGKSVALPRNLTRHLDKEPDHNVEFWIRNYELTEGLVVPKLTTPDLERLVKQYAAFLASRKIVAITIEEHVRHLTKNVIPYFLRLSPPLTDPNDWASASIKMLIAFENKGLTGSQIVRSNVALRKFHKWLAEENVIIGSGVIALRNPILETKVTPLKATISAHRILELVAKQSDQNFAMMLLCGYFISLRPQEIFGLKVSDFRAGMMVEALESSKAAASLGLYSKLAVNIVRQRTKKMSVIGPKAGSGGWVTCF